MRRLERSERSVIAAVGGFALGGGMEVALDLRERGHASRRLVRPEYPARSEGRAATLR